VISRIRVNPIFVLPGGARPGQINL